MFPSSARWNGESKHIQSVPVRLGGKKCHQQEKNGQSMGGVMDKKELKEETKRKGLLVLPWDWQGQRCYKKHEGITECCRGICCSVRLEIEKTH